MVLIWGQVKSALIICVMDYIEVIKRLLGDWFLKAIIGTMFFVALVFVAQWLVDVTGLPIPPAVAAMLALALTLAALGKVPVILNEGASFLFRVFPLLFIPAIIGVVTVLDIVAQHWLVLLFAVTVSSLLGLIVSATLYRLLRARKRSSL